MLNKVGKGKLFTRWLINSACRYAAELKHEHKLNLYLTINLRADDLYDAELPHMLIQALALWKLSPANIVLELTEDGFLELNEITEAIINQLTDYGFKLALDDFGTGFSSLSRLRTMPISLIKKYETDPYRLGTSPIPFRGFARFLFANLVPHLHFPEKNKEIEFRVRALEQRHSSSGSPRKTLRSHRPGQCSSDLSLG
jgi:hypothetical protein